MVSVARGRATAGAKAGVLFISYDGVLEPLGESQVTSYLNGLAQDFEIRLLSFEKRRDLGDAERLRRRRSDLAAAGIAWRALPYHRHPSLLATTFDVAAGIVAACRETRSHRVRLVHARGYVPSLIALAVKRLTGTPFIFDMRGLWPEEKVVAGRLRRGSAIYRMVKYWERRFLESADAVVSLTVAGVEAVHDFGYAIPSTTPFVVIPTCADLTRFSPGPRDSDVAARLGLGDGPVIGCVGTMSNWYLRSSMLDYLALLTEMIDTLCVLIVTHEDHDALRRDALAAGIPAARLRITRASFSDMPAHVRLIDAGLFFITPSLAKKGSAATKLAEFLGAGVPVIINDGVGDSGRIVREGGAGLVLPDTSPDTFSASIPAVRALLDDPEVPGRCRATAERWFDLRMGVRRYADLYERLGA